MSKCLGRVYSYLLSGFHQTIRPTAFYSKDMASEKKRCVEEDEENVSQKKSKIENANELNEGDVRRKRKMAALLMMFCGKDFCGMQRNEPFPTIESALMKALLDSDLASEKHMENKFAQLQFQRATRTDKGVSAVGQVCSCRIFTDVDDPKEALNKHLPETIRIIDVLKTTKNFNCHRWADSRTYSYNMPTFAFTPQTEEVKEDFRVKEETLKHVSQVLNLFLGTHNFYNYTSGKAVTDKSCMRYIMEWEVGTPYIKEGIEMVELQVHGQSFMIHQIRKMIGMMIAIVQGLVDEEYLQATFGPDRMDVPKAPGVGLMLEEIHYKIYNKRFGDETRPSISFSKYHEEIEAFKHKYIIPALHTAEKEEKSMVNWLESLRENHFKEDERKESLDNESTVTEEKAENSKEVNTEQTDSRKSDTQPQGS